MLSAGVRIVERSSLGLASILVRKGQNVELAAQVRDHFGIELPREPRRAAAGDLAFLCTAPGAWLAIRDNPDAAFSSHLLDSLGARASVSDQSDGFIVLRISGPRARDALCKIVPIDLHRRAFAVNQAAVTVVEHMPATIWRLPDDAAGCAVFEMTSLRSFAESFRHAVSQSTAEFLVRRSLRGALDPA